MKKTFKIFWVLTLSAAMTVCGGTAAAAENQGLTEANDGVFVVNVHNFETGEDDQLFYQEAGADTYAVNSVETTPSYCPPGRFRRGLAQSGRLTRRYRRSITTGRLSM